MKSYYFSTGVKKITSDSNKLQDKFHNPLSAYINITVFAELKQVQHSIFLFANKNLFTLIQTRKKMTKMALCGSPEMIARRLTLQHP